MSIIECNEEASGYLDWMPSEHTVVHFPFKENAVDTITWMTLTNSWTQTSLWRTFNTTVDYSNTTQAKKMNFICVRMKINSWLNGTTCCTQLFDVWERPISYCTSHSQSQFRNSIHCNDTNNNRPYINTGMTQWTWFWYCAWYENGTAYYWKNGVKQTISTICKSSGGLSELIRVQWAGVNITLSDLRCEDVIPSQEDLEKYFNKHKSEYWY